MILCGPNADADDIDCWTMPQTPEHKKALRADLREQLRRIDAQELRRRSADAAARLTHTDAFAGAGAIMIFLPLAYEIDARPVAVRAWQTGKTVTVPQVGYAQRRMIPLEIRSLAEPMDTDRHGVQTPTHGRPIPVEMIDLVVVPGLAFDRAGHRLGRGGGFYDRFLSQPDFHGAACGLGLDEQLVDRVPATGHDVALDMLVTDEQVLMFSPPERVRRPA